MWRDTPIQYGASAADGDGCGRYDSPTDIAGSRQREFDTLSRVRSFRWYGLLNFRPIRIVQRSVEAPILQSWLPAVDDDRLGAVAR